MLTNKQLKMQLNKNGIKKLKVNLYNLGQRGSRHETVQICGRKYIGKLGQKRFCIYNVSQITKTKEKLHKKIFVIMEVIDYIFQ